MTGIEDCDVPASPAQMIGAFCVSDITLEKDGSTEHRIRRSQGLLLGATQMLT